MRASVVLPDPFAPERRTTSPGAIVSDAPDRTGRSSKRFVTASARRINGGSGRLGRCSVGQDDLEAALQIAPDQIVALAREIAPLETLVESLDEVEVDGREIVVGIV